MECDQTCGEQEDFELISVFNGNSLVDVAVLFDHDLTWVLAHHLETHVALEVVLQGRLGIVDGGVHVVNEVRRHQLLIGVGENTLPGRFRWLNVSKTHVSDVRWCQWFSCHWCLLFQWFSCHLNIQTLNWHCKMFLFVKASCRSRWPSSTGNQSPRWRCPQTGWLAPWTVKIKEIKM